MLFTYASSASVKALLDPAVQSKAYELALALQNEGMSAEKKAEAFNRLMGEWMAKTGMAFGTSILNAIRELAVAAVKAKSEVESAKCEGRNVK